MIEILILIGIGIAFLTTVKVSLEIVYKDQKKLAYTPETFKLPDGITFQHVQEIIRDAHEIELEVLLKAFEPLETEYQGATMQRTSGGYQPLPTLLDLRNPPKPPPMRASPPLPMNPKPAGYSRPREIEPPHPELIEPPYTMQAKMKLYKHLMDLKLPIPKDIKDIKYIPPTNTTWIGPDRTDPYQYPNPEYYSRVGTKDNNGYIIWRDKDGNKWGFKQDEASFVDDYVEFW